MRGARALAAVLTVTFVATAAAAVGPTVRVTVNPQRGGAVAQLSVTATGPFTSGGGLPNIVEIALQRGFGASVYAKKVLCTSAQAAARRCPASSQVGTGTALATASVPGIGDVQDTISLKLYLGAAQEPGDIWSLAVVGTDSVLGQSLTANGRMLKLQGGRIELLISHLPDIPGVTLDSLSLRAFAKRRAIPPPQRTSGPPRIFKRKRTFGLITNPARCPAGHWTGSFTIGFPSGPPVTGGLSIPCR